MIENLQLISFAAAFILMFFGIAVGLISIFNDAAFGPPGDGEPGIATMRAR